MISISDGGHPDPDELFELFRDWDREYPFDRAVFDDSLAKLDPKNTRLITARENGKLIAYAQLTRRVDLGFAEYLEVVQLLVAEAARGRGLGKRLMAEAERIAGSEGIGIVKLSSRIQRSKAHVFYEELGYELGKVSKFYQKKLSG